jgi:hypothetical protein
MRPLALAARLRRPRLLAIASLLVAGTVAGCIAGEPIAPGSVGAIPGRYILTMFSAGTEADSLPILAYRTEDGLPVYIRYATIDMYEDSTFVEVFELHVMNAAGTSVLDTKWDVGNGTWSVVGTDILFTAILRPALLPASTTWTGYQGTGGGPYALNLRRQTEPQKNMHYRRY